MVSEGPRPVSASLRLKVGNSFADVAIDGVVVEHDFYVGTVSSTPSKHVLTVEKPGFGRFLPRNLEVDAAGRIFELRPDGRHPVRGELLFAVPKQGLSAPPDWQHETNKKACSHPRAGGRSLASVRGPCWPSQRPPSPPKPRRSRPRRPTKRARSPWPLQPSNTETSGASWKS